MSRFLACSIAVLVAVLPMFGQTAKVLAPHRPIPPRIKNGKLHGSSALRSMVGGLWMTDPNSSATLYLKNNVEVSAIKVTPVLHLSNGAQYPLPDVNLEPSGTAQVSINDGLQAQGIASFAPLSGYVELRYNWPWDALCATIRNIDTVHSTIFMYSVPSLLPVDSAHPAAKADVQTLEGLWWKQEPNVTGFISLLNTSSQAVEVNLQLLDNANAVFANHTTVVSPHGMKTVALDELLNETSAVGGIQISFNGTKTDLQIYGGLEDRNVGYSAQLPVVAVPDASAKQNGVSIAELGLMAGAADPMMSFPANTTFTPYSVLRNASDAPISVTPTLWWMQGGAPHSAPSPAITLLPHQSQSLDVMSLISGSGLKNFNGTVNLLLDAQGKTSGLIAVAGSVDQTNTYVFGVAPKGVLESASRSVSYWSTGNGDDTMVTLWNPADEAQDLSFRLLYTGGHYAYPIHLAPRESRTFNISEIIHSQVPDAEGNTVPVAVQEGSATISGSQADNQHILVAMDAGTYNVKKATCGPYCQSCDGVQSFWVDLGSFSVGVNQVHQEFLKDQWYSGQQHDLSSNSNWSSSDTSKATVSGGNVTGVSAGSAVISANYTSSEPVGVQNLCQGSFWSCPPGFTGGGGSGTGTVTPPHITSISPNFAKLGANVTVTISGSGFGTSPHVNTDGTGIAITISSNPAPTNVSITALFSVSSSAPLGSQNITVTNGTTASDNSVIFEVIPTSTAVPVNYRLISAQDLGGGVVLGIGRNSAWDSSTGNLNDLSSCSMREYVTYPNTNNATCPNNSPPQLCYFPASPPWAASGQGSAYPNPTSPTPGPANGGRDQDTNSVSNLNFVKPYRANSFSATQYVQYSCGGGSWVNLYGPVVITRSVFQSGTKWVGQISASDTPITSQYTLP
jgi:hypothetical protein